MTKSPSAATVSRQGTVPSRRTSGAVRTSTVSSTRSVRPSSRLSLGCASVSAPSVSTATKPLHAKAARPRACRPMMTCTLTSCTGCVRAGSTTSSLRSTGISVIRLPTTLSSRTGGASTPLRRRHSSTSVSTLLARWTAVSSRRSSPSADRIAVGTPGGQAKIS